MKKILLLLVAVFMAIPFACAENTTDSEVTTNVAMQQNNGWEYIGDIEAYYGTSRYSGASIRTIKLYVKIINQQSFYQVSYDGKSYYAVTRNPYYKKDDDWRWRADFAYKAGDYYFNL